MGTKFVNECSGCGAEILTESTLDFGVEKMCLSDLDQHIRDEKLTVDGRRVPLTIHQKADVCECGQVYLRYWVDTKTKSTYELARDMKIDEFLEEVSACNTEPLLYPTDLKEAIIGKVEHFELGEVILLDKEKCLNIFCERDGMTPEEAVEFFYYNTLVFLEEA